MSIITTDQFISSSEHEPSAEQKDIIRLYEYDYPPLSTSVRVEVVGPTDGRIPDAIKMEIAAMEALGDPAEEVRQEFIEYNNKSLFFLVFKKESEGLGEDLLSMGRVIPYDAATGIKSLNDLASIPDWHSEEVGNGAPNGLHSVAQIEQAFMKESGCEDFSKVWDIATLGFDLELDRSSHAAAYDAIMTTFCQEVIREWEAGGLTHIISFNQEEAHKAFRRLGYNFRSMFGLAPMVYDSFQSGEGMTAQIAWLSVEQDVVDPLKAHRTRHLAQVALLLGAEPDAQHITQKAS